MSLSGSFEKKDSGNPQPGKWQVGDKIANRFEIHQILGGEGKSGMGIIYVCHSLEHGNIYALKTFQEKYFFSEASQKLFEQEALIWTELEKHSYIVQAHWVERLEDRLFIILEFIAPDNKGRNTLTHYLGGLVLSDILKISIQFCYGMEYAYSKGIGVHRDIKPDNIMITSDKTVKITDFGLVKVFQEMQLKEELISSGEKPSISIFQSKGKRICGTLPYMAPEQFDGYADKRSDIYAFGIVLYQVITNGRLPFIGRTLQEFERLHKHERMPVVSSPLFPIIQKCLEKEPDNRYQDFAAIRDELQNRLLKETGETISSSGGENNSLTAIGLIQKGVAFASLGKHQEAISCCDRAIKMESENAEVWYGKGLALYHLGKHQEAVVHYDKAIEINPEYLNCWHMKGMSLERLAKFQEALVCYDKVIESNPEDFLVWYCKGGLLNNLDKFQEALTCYDRAIEINPRDIYAWNNRGNVLFHLGSYQEAIVNYDRALKIDPSCIQAQNNKMNCLEKIDGKAYGEVEGDKTIETDSDDARAWFNKGCVLGQSGRHQDAIACYDEAVRQDPGYKAAWNNKGCSLIELGKYKEAIICLDRVLKIDPKYPDALFNKGGALVRLHRYIAVLGCCVRLAWADPEYYKRNQHRK